MPGRTRTQNGASRKLDEELDRALVQTFPASDPFSVGRFTSTEPPSRPVDRKAPQPEAAPEVAPGRRRKRKART
jgi:hypothetical protein